MVGNKNYSELIGEYYHFEHFEIGNIHIYWPTFVIANLYITDPFRPKGKGDRLGDFESREGR